MTALPVKREPITAPPRMSRSRTEEGLYLEIPGGATTLAGFREWSSSDAFPDRGKIVFICGEVIIDMSPERIGSHHALRYEISRVLGNLVFDADSGEFYLDGVRIVNKEAEVSNEPDGMYA